MLRKACRKPWVLGLAAMATVTMAACGGGAGGGGGGGTSQEVAEALGYQSAEGSSTAPLAIGDLSTELLVRYDGKVGNGSVTGGESFYLVQGATPGVDYTVTLANLTDDADVYVYPGDPTYAGSPEARTEQGFSDEAFTLSAAQDVTSLFIQVTGDKTSKGATYTLSVFPKPKSEGSLASPVDLFDELPVSRPGSTVAYDETAGIGDGDDDTQFDSYYKVQIPSTITAGTRILISLSNPTADVDLYVTTDSAFATGFTDTWNESSPANGNKRCKTLYNNAVSEACEYIATGSAVTLYIGVDGYYAPEGAAYTLNITKAPVGAGVAATPCNLGNAPGIWALSFSGGSGCSSFPLSVVVDNAPGIAKKGITDPDSDDSYYVIGNLTSGKTYVLTLEDPTDLADLYVYGKDSTFTTALPACKPPYDNPNAQRCTFVAGPTTVHFAVDGYYSLAGAAYKLSVFPEFVAIGTAESPEGLTAGACLADTDVGCVYADRTVGPDTVLGVPSASSESAETASAGFSTFADEVAAGTNGDSYFSIPVTQSCTGMDNCQYSVTLTSLSGDVNLYVYKDSTFTKPVCTSFNGGTAAEKCIVEATVPTLYIAVDGFLATNGAAYTLTVRQLPLEGEGTPDQALKIGSAPLKYGGKVIGGVGTEGAGDVEDSHYFFYGAPGKFYRVTLADMKEGSNLDLHVAMNPSDPDSYSGSADVSGCSPAPTLKDTRSCVVQTPLSGKAVILIGVDGFNGEKPGAAYPFTILVEETEEPPAANVEVLSPIPYEDDGVVKQDKTQGIGLPGQTLDSFYRFTVTKSGTYRIMISKLSGDADLYVFPVGNDSWEKPIPKEAKSGPTCPFTLRGQDKTGFLEEYCDLTVSIPKEGGPVDVFFAVDGYNVAAKSAGYLITIGPAPR